MINWINTSFCRFHYSVLCGMQQVWCNCNAIKNTVDAFSTKAPTIACILKNSSFKTTVFENSIRNNLAGLIELHCIEFNRSAVQSFYEYKQSTEKSHTEIREWTNIVFYRLKDNVSINSEVKWTMKSTFFWSATAQFS